jgi:hypothetical protein
MTTISKDSPCLSITTVALNRLPVFRTERLKAIACAALDEARRSGGFVLFAYVILKWNEIKGAKRPERQSLSAQQAAEPQSASELEGRGQCAYDSAVR